MDHEHADRGIWEAVVSAERGLLERRAEFRRDVEGRRRILSAALDGSVWDQGAALGYLRSFHDDVPDLLGRLVELALTDRWALAARQAICAGRRDVVEPFVVGLVLERAATADATDFRRMAELLVALEAWRSLSELLDRARASGDESMEVVADFRKKYGPMMDAH